MKKTSTNAAWPQLEAAEPSRDSDRLRLAVAEIQSITSSSAEQIIGLGKLGVIALESPLATASDREMMAQLLLAVVEKAQVMNDSVSFEAENLGIIYRDEARERRAAAHRG